MTQDTDELIAALARETAHLLDRYDYSDKTTVRLLSESENKVYVVDDPVSGQKDVVRVSSGRLTYHEPDQIASEMRWLQHLHDNTDIVVPKVKPARDGSLVQTMHASDLDRPRHAVIYSFISGDEPAEDNLVEGFERLGGISAEMHEAARAWQPPEGFHRPLLTAEVILDDKLNWQGWQDGIDVSGQTLALLSRLDGVVRKRLGALSADNQRFGLIHADLRLANLLVEGDRTAIIDFDDLGFGWFLYDLATALSFLEERPDVPDLIASWLAGYRRVASVPADAEAEIWTLIMLRRLQLVGWVGYQYQRLAFAREIGHDFTRDSCDLAEAYLSRH